VKYYTFYSPLIQITKQMLLGEVKRKLHLIDNILHIWKIHVHHLDKNVSYKVKLFKVYENTSRKARI